jgi:stage V sporulation protein AA
LFFMKYIISLKNTFTSREADVPLAAVVTVVPQDKEIAAFLRETKIAVNDIVVLEVIEVIGMIVGRFGNCNVTSVGASSCSILFEPKARVTAYRVLKTGLVFLILFFGGALAIMNFHADVDMGQVLKSIVAFYAGGSGDVLWAAVAYSAGIGAGFLFVLNLFKPRSDKTPSLLDLDLHDYKAQKERYMAEKSKK